MKMRVVAASLVFLATTISLGHTKPAATDDLSLFLHQTLEHGIGSSAVFVPEHLPEN